MPDNELAIPIYLDTNALLDLLATIEDGFKMVERITSNTSEIKKSEIEGGTEFGIANVLNFLKLNLHGSVSRVKNQQAGDEHQYERYHTYGSLLNRLRNYLRELNSFKIIKNAEDWDTLALSDFIEARGKFLPNPLQASLKIMDRLLTTFLLSSSLVFIPEKTTPQQKKETKQEIRQYQELHKFFEGIIKDLELGSLSTYVIELSNLSDQKIVTSLFIEYLRDRTGTELPFGEYQLLGKVVRIVQKEDSLDLLRGSALSGVNESILSQLFEGFKNAEEHGIKLPDITTKVEAPVIQVLPLAIYI